MGERSVKVYVSSTVLDLRDERRRVLEWLRKARYHAVDSYLPDSETVRASCLADVASCDLYVLILGWRYGFQPEGDNPEGLSITHLEFREAGLRGVPRVALLRTGASDLRQSDLLDPERAPRILQFRNEVSAATRTAEFSDNAGLLEGLSTGVKAELAKLDGRRTPSDWLARHADDLAARFADHMTGTALAPALRPDQLYLDLVIVERRPEAREEAEAASTARPLAALMDEVSEPVILTGEGGAGKTASLLHLAAESAARAVDDPAAPVPIYVNLVRLTKLDDVPELHRLIVDSVSFADEWSELTDLDVLRDRRVVYLFDSLNELPEQMQRTAAAILVRFIGKRQGRGVLVASRPSVHLDQLAHGAVQARMFEILRLRPEQVQEFLRQLGLGTLYDRMPAELRELAGNPFMLVAVARTLAGTPSGEMPRNRGRLYERFVQGWMRNEAVRGASPYHYERVKQPLLAHLATRMTALGRTSLILDPALEEEIEERLEAIHTRVRRLGGMPENWTVDGCLAEVVDDGLLRRRDDELQFLHQSVQEYFTALHVARRDPVLLAELTPRLDLSLVTTHELPDVPAHRLVPVLLLVAGLLDDATPVVAALVGRHPVLAAAVIAAANRVDGATLARLTGEWRGLLRQEEYPRRAVACACLVRTGHASRPDVQAVVDMAISSSRDDSWMARRALRHLDQPDDVARAAVEGVLALPSAEFDDREYTIGQLLEALPARSVVAAVLNRSREAGGDDVARRRLGGMLAAVAEPVRTEEIQALGVGDPRLAVSAQEALDDASKHRTVRAAEAHFRVEERRRKFEDRVAEEIAALQKADDGEVTAAVTAQELARRQAAITVSVARRLDVVDALVESILHIDEATMANALSTAATTALSTMLGPRATVDTLVARMQEPRILIAVLDETVPEGESPAEPPAPVLAEVNRLRPGLDKAIEHRSNARGTWSLEKRGIFYRPRYEVHASSGVLELWDCNIAARAVSAIAKINHPTATTALRGAVDDDDPRIMRLALNELVRRQVPDLVPWLMAKLRGRVPPAFAAAALDALAFAGSPAALDLVSDLLRLTGGPYNREEHPSWGRGPWRRMIRDVLAPLDADDRVRAALDDALAGTDTVARAAAVVEYARCWFGGSSGLATERLAAWRAPVRVARVVDLALHDDAEPVRRAAQSALAFLPVDDATVLPLLGALHGENEPARVGAAEALAGLHGPAAPLDDVTRAMQEMATGPADLALRRRAGAVLAGIENGLEPFYRPIRRAFEENEPHRALVLVAAALDVLPGDVNIHWWRGHALNALGRPAEAAESFQRAADLDDQSSAMVLQALAETLLDLGDVDRAVAAARRAVQLAPADADAHAVLAWSCYRAGATDECIDSAAEALDRDPIHPTARWILLLGQVRRGDLAAARAALDRARCVRELLLTHPDAAFVADALDALEVPDGETARLRDEVRTVLRSGPQVVDT